MVIGFYLVHLEPVSCRSTVQSVYIILHRMRHSVLINRKSAQAASAKKNFATLTIRSAAIFFWQKLNLVLVQLLILLVRPPPPYPDSYGSVFLPGPSTQMRKANRTIQCC